jgi:hypothetical protein
MGSSLRDCQSSLRSTTGKDFREIQQIVAEQTAAEQCASLTAPTEVAAPGEKPLAPSGCYRGNGGVKRSGTCSSDVSNYETDLANWNAANTQYETYLADQQAYETALASCNGTSSTLQTNVQSVVSWSNSDGRLKDLKDKAGQVLTAACSPVIPGVNLSLGELLDRGPGDLQAQAAVAIVNGWNDAKPSEIFSEESIASLLDNKSWPDEDKLLYLRYINNE